MSAQDEQRRALHALWREAAEKNIEAGVDWPGIVIALLSDIDAVVADREKAVQQARAEAWDRALEADVEQAKRENPYREVQP